ncbi:hypothetical protein NBO_8g0021 [Nosema bombycis CQ1]|uniref:Uncharacterized protein n=1 Tax=Nosema bombycis (strain CQ1 / CVCC 102059) TaxID=578461 RepID=R0KW71_NOSB1|nr:hypothetical protein NBO_8g0021 [Nosema bombycis CQ1]|eukprot:EOB15156.1 hypothetical protein NBO_8g0021 [Nosema bombycis CQ1]
MPINNKRDILLKKITLNYFPTQVFIYHKTNECFSEETLRAEGTFYKMHSVLSSGRLNFFKIYTKKKL